MHFHPLRRMNTITTRMHTLAMINGLKCAPVVVAFVVDGFFLCTFCCRRVTVVPESKAPDAIATPCGTVIDVREEHPLKALFPIVGTLFGRVIDVREEHPEKAPTLIVVTLFGRVIEVREEHPEKAYFPIVVTLFVC